MSKLYFFMSESATPTTTDKRECWFPKTGSGYYDKAAKRYFDTKAEKRAWMKSQGMRECGELVNPTKHINGRERAKANPATVRSIQEHIAKSGGVEGLLRRVQTGQGRFV